MTKIGFIGAGQMAKALARGFVSAEIVAGSDINFCDPSEQAANSFLADVNGAKACPLPAELVDSCDVVFVAVKPQHLASVFSTIHQPSCLVVSIVAGATLSQLSSGLGTERIIRVMPNTPCLVGMGASAYCRGVGATDQDAQLLDELLHAVGVAFELAEHNMDAVTGLSGSGPAFVYQFIEALSDGGVCAGLPRAVATQLAMQTVMGAAKMVGVTGDHPGLLKDQVASPGGTTIAGLHALEQGGLRGTVMNAVVAASDRSRELGSS